MPIAERFLFCRDVLQNITFRISHIHARTHTHTHICMYVCVCAYDYFARNMASLPGAYDSLYCTMIYGAAEYYKVCYRIVLEIFSS